MTDDKCKCGRPSTDPIHDMPSSNLFHHHVEPARRNATTTTVAGEWAEKAIAARRPHELHSPVCTGCVHEGAEGWTDAEDGLSNPRTCGARACDLCGQTTCATDEGGPAGTVKLDDCRDLYLCDDDRRTHGCNGCPGCSDPDDLPGGRDR